jgi:uncharacterized protein YacL
LTEKDLKNKKQKNDIISYFLIGASIILSLLQIHQILFIQPTKIDFGILLFFIWFAVTIYLDDIKQVTEKSEKKALWKIVIRCTGLIVGIIVVALALLDTLYLHRII